MYVQDRDLLSEMPDLSDEDTWYKWFGGLSEDEKKEVRGIAEVLPRVGPIPGPQRAAFNTKAKVTGYGGAAGGGKTALIALLTLLNHKRTVVFRNDATELKGYIDDLIMFHGSKSGLNRQAGAFYFTDTHMCEWGGLGDPGSQNAWRGRAHDFIAYDEVTEIAQPRVLFVKTWCRTPIRGQRCRLLMTFNPPGSEDDATGQIASGQWVVDYFAPWLDERHVNPAAPGEVRHFITNPAGEEEEVDSDDPVELKLGGEVFIAEPESRTFIPSTVKDNPYLAGTDYEHNLLSLREPLRSKMLLGDFRKGILDTPFQILPSSWVDEAMERWTPDGRAAREMSAMGVDVARGGTAWTVLSPRHGFWWDKLERHPGSRTRDGGEVAAVCTRRLGGASAMINIDANGVGASPFDIMKGAGMRINGVIPQQRRGLIRLGAIECYNMRTWLLWVLSMILDPSNGLNPALPKDKRLRSDMVSLQYHYVGKQVLAESKDEVRARLHRSTDDLDAICLSLFNVAHEPEWSRLIGRPKAETGYTPRREPYRGPAGWMHL